MEVALVFPKATQRSSAKKSKNVIKFTGKHLWQGLFFYLVKLQANDCTGVFCEFCEIVKNPFFHRTTLVAAPLFLLLILTKYLSTGLNMDV